MSWLDSDIDRYQVLVGAWVSPDTTRCVQCGVCSFNCPMGIDIRGAVWRGEPVKDSRCLTCGECIRRCPRGLLRFQEIVPSRDTRDPGCR
jgi:ferredoxin